MYQPKMVYSFLKTNENYRLEEALDVSELGSYFILVTFPFSSPFNHTHPQICAMAKLVDATAYLLERTGDVKGAFKLTLDVSNKIM